MRAAPPFAWATNVQVFHLFSHPAEEKGVKLSLELADNLPEAVVTDAVRLQQLGMIGWT